MDLLIFVALKLLFIVLLIFGEMAEWFKAHAWKVCVPSKVPWVRIPLSPPFFNFNLIKINVKIDFY